MKESVKDKKLDSVKKVPSPLPMMASDIPMIAEPSAPAEPGEDFRKLQGTQEIEWFAERAIRPLQSAEFAFEGK